MDNRPPTDARHVEAVEKGLDRSIDMRRPSVTLELEYALCDGRDDGVMPSLDVGEQARETVIVVVHFGRPRNRLVRLRIVTMQRDLLPALLRFELIRTRFHVFRQRGIRDGIRNALTFLRRAKEGVLEILGKLWSREIDEFLEALRIPALDLFDTRHLMQALR